MRTSFTGIFFAWVFWTVAKAGLSISFRASGIVFSIDAKLFEVRKYMTRNDVDVVTAIDKVLGIKLK